MNAIAERMFGNEIEKATRGYTRVGAVEAKKTAPLFEARHFSIK
jgi:hypothetical protein